MKLCLNFYDFLHKMVVADKINSHLLHNLVDWLISQMVFFKKNSSTVTVNLMQLVDMNLNDSQKPLLFSELDQLTSFFSLQKEERKRKIKELLKVGSDRFEPNEELPKNQSILFDEFISDDDIDDINFSDDLEEMERENAEDSSSRSNTPSSSKPALSLNATYPKIVVITTLVEPFENMVTHHLLAGKDPSVQN